MGKPKVKNLTWKSNPAHWVTAFRFFFKGRHPNHQTGWHIILKRLDKERRGWVGGTPGGVPKGLVSPPPEAKFHFQRGEKASPFPNPVNRSLHFGGGVQAVQKVQKKTTQRSLWRTWWIPFEVRFSPWKLQQKQKYGKWNYLKILQSHPPPQGVLPGPLGRRARPRVGVGPRTTRAATALRMAESESRTLPKGQSGPPQPGGK